MVNESEVPWLTSTRFRLSILYFFGFVCLYAQRVNLSIAIVTMVADKHDHHDHSSDNETKHDEKCPELDHKGGDGEFEWSKEMQGLILGAFFWGYLVLQVPGGRLSEKYGAKKVVAISMFTVAILTLLTPVVARANAILLLILRIVVGIAESSLYPSAQAFWAQWAPPHERSRLIGFTYAGGQFGNAMIFPIGGLLCAYAPDGGWPFVFYFIGSVGFVWTCVWTAFAHDTPNECPYIIQIERDYINLSLGKGDGNKKVTTKPNIPWKSIFTSRPFWGILVAHTCGNYGAYMLLTMLPTYMKQVLKFDIKANGVYSMMPYLAFWAVIALGGIIADKLITTGTLPIKSCRKLLATLGLILPGIALIGAGFMECDQWQGAVALITLSVGLCGLQFCSFFCNHSDIAPMFAGTLFGLTNTSATIGGIISPYIVSAMTTNSTREEWQNTFYLAAAIYAFGAIVYLICAEADVQPWAKVEGMDGPGSKSPEEIDLNKKDSKHSESMEDNGRGLRHSSSQVDP